MKNLLFIIFASLILSVTVTAQQIPDVSTVKTEKGMMVLNNNKVQPYSFLVPGGDPQGKQNSDGSLVIATESGVITVYFGNRSVFLDKKKTYTEAETLIAHRDQDISTQEKAWKAKLQDLEKGESFVRIFGLTNNLFPNRLLSTATWIYTAPTSDNTDRTIYQTVLIGDQILMLGAVFEQTTKSEEVRSFLTKSLESITLLPPQKPAASPAKKLVKRKVTKK